MKPRDEFVNDRQPQSALREWRRQIGQPVALVALIAIAAVLGLAGPFGTEARLTLLPRLAYWLVTVFATYGWGLMAGLLLDRPTAALPFWQRVLVVGSATGAGVCVAVLAINLVTFGWWPGRAEWLPLLGTIFVIAVIITAALGLISRQAPAAHAPSPAPPALPPILDRLPLDKRGPLVALSVEDHYVRVRTTKGEELVLMRLSDAIREVGATPGDQVHRSHWAAFGQVTSVRREGDRAILTMRVGDDLPVSRANLPKIKEAGLLPR
ncbi:LytTR family DNA-binding domain-containing protein [Tropicibacter oceani]|uniref:LytTR family DNA-binding domain-containing protein n=1 Tax=Tropicibacter oceani TaxID=3058420 RepID=A0ABY8QHR6_9RHOB|nr:LytTR family DNA-binding domain-containing protein [Tropicibacter oceani]WGW03327.1 LytTR family DNA-binding domain-containing protein [Tropicibacter oceani]